MIKPGTLCIATYRTMPEGEPFSDGTIQYTTEIGWYMGLVDDDDPTYGHILMHSCRTEDRAIVRTYLHVYCDDVRPVTPNDLIRWADSNPSTDFSWT